MVKDPRAPLRVGALRPLIEPWPVVIRSRSGLLGEHADERPLDRIAECWRGRPVSRRDDHPLLSSGVVMTLVQGLTDGRRHAPPS